MVPKVFAIQKAATVHHFSETVSIPRISARNASFHQQLNRYYLFHGSHLTRKIPFVMIAKGSFPGNK